MEATPDTSQTFKKYDVETGGEIPIFTDIKINPDFYIHSAIVRAQQALTKENLQEGFLQYRILIEHIEVLVKSAKFLPLDYEKQIKEYQASYEYKKEDKGHVRGVKLANFKLNLIMSEVFGRKTDTNPIYG